MNIADIIHAGVIMNGRFGGNSVFPREEKNETYVRYLTGDSYLAMLSTEGVVTDNVTFEPGYHNFWYVRREGGQVLLMTGGRSWYREWSKPARELKIDDVVYTLTGMKCWYGAARGSWFAHIAVGIPAPGVPDEWLEPVSDAEYNLLP